VRTLPDGPLHLRVAAPQQAPWQEALRQLHEVAARMQVEEAPIAGGGVLIETADGRLRLDNSFAARLQRQHDELRRLVAGVLFSKEDAVPMPEA